MAGMNQSEKEKEKEEEGLLGEFRAKNTQRRKIKRVLGKAV